MMLHNPLTFTLYSTPVAWHVSVVHMYVHNQTYTIHLAFYSVYVRFRGRVEV